MGFGRPTGFTPNTNGAGKFKFLGKTEETGGNSGPNTENTNTNDASKSTPAGGFQFGGNSNSNTNDATEYRTRT